MKRQMFTLPTLAEEPQIAAAMKELRDHVGAMAMELAKYKEQYIRAYLAETGYLPSEVVLVERRVGTDVYMWLENKKDNPIFGDKT